MFREGRMDLGPELCALVDGEETVLGVTADVSPVALWRSMKNAHGPALSVGSMMLIESLAVEPQRELS
ncbi:hypothetical protein [Streptomyces sp. NPDC097610]|uniref:hypothetical protein n=1 Tax=Streptomyces sp. NPDC097610 TaxID=3157227 RepID=UPI003323CEE0